MWACGSPSRKAAGSATLRVMFARLGRALVCLTWLLSAWLLSAWITPRTAGAVEVRIRGGSEIDLVAASRPGDVIVRGEIADEMGASLGRVSLRVEAFEKDGRPIQLPAPSSCGGGDASVVRRGARGYDVSTDERGAFCVVATGQLANATFRASFAGNKFYEGTDSSVTPVPEGEQRVQTILRFDAPPTSLDLDKETHTVSVSLRISRSDAARLLVASTKQEGLTLNLVDERGAVVAKATTRGDGKARFDLASSALDGPGDGELRAEFAGDGQLAPAKASVAITRVATATVLVPKAVGGDPDSGVAIEVEVTSRHGEVNDGVVEAVVGNDAVGAARVERGRARLVATFQGGAAGKVPVTVRFVPGSPFWRAGPAAQTEIVVDGPSIVRQVILALVGVGLLGWIVMKWRRAPKSEKRDSVLPPPPSGRPEILVLDRPSGLRGWRGVVTDAHDGYAIAGAELSVVTPSFEARSPLVRVTTDAEGRFAIDLADVPKDARLIVEGELHATYEQALPAPSLLRVAVVTRRRALLDRLVRWARSQGSPFDSSKEPTPGHVRRVAARTGSGEVETWASRVEHAAFGPEAVTSDVERTIVDREPGRARKDPAQPPPGSPAAP